MRMPRIAPATLLVGAGWLLWAAGTCGAVDSAFDALRKSAEQGDPQAARRVATAYDSGMGVPRDDVEAARWYEVAARLGDADAQYRLGVLYREGRGVLRDARRAYAWFDLAASQRDFLDADDAAAYRDEAARGLDAADLSAARGLAGTWRSAAAGGRNPP